VGPSGIYPKYRAVQIAVVEALNDKFGLNLIASDAVMLAYLPAERYDTLNDKQKHMLEPFKRGAYYRLCLTPYFEAAERQGLLHS
ncbi:MAG: hypothetical protein ACRD3W_24160, partial [Terriglobales bacterium]